MMQSICRRLPASQLFTEKILNRAGPFDQSSFSPSGVLQGQPHGESVGI